MLVQPRPDGLRLIRQHDHALLSGAFAGAWRARPRPEGLPPATVVAAHLHDVVWLREDREPRLDPGTGRPHDFSSLPPGLKEPMVEEGLLRLAAVEPDVAALVREHHAALREERPAEGEAAWVRFADALSLFACLTPPDADPAAVPPWLGPSVLRPPGAEDPLGAEWLGPDVLRLDPFPLAGDGLTVGVPYADLVGRTFAGRAALLEAWREAERGVWTLRLLR